MATETITLLTRNPNKLRIAREAFHPYGIVIEPSEFDIDEIQASSSAEIARAAVKLAYDVLRRPVLREDHSFYINALGIPGPFMAYADKTVSAEQLIRIVDTLPDRHAHFDIAAAYMDSGGNLFETSYQVPVTIATEARGDPALNWERVMVLEGETTTFAETPGEQRDYLWAQNYSRVAEYIINQA